MRFGIAFAVLCSLVGCHSMALAQASGNGPNLKELIERAKKKPKRGSGETAPVAAAANLAPGAEQGKIREEYTINAQYRGTVKKAFMDIGHCTAVFDTRADGKFNVKIDGSVTDPEDKARRYELSVDADYHTAGNHIELQADRSKFNQEAERHRERVLKDIPFIYIAKFNAYPPVSKDTTWLLDGREFTIKYTRTEEGEMQVTVLEHGGMIGKIFLEPTENIPHTIKKFRVIGTNDVVLSFVMPGK